MKPAPGLILAAILLVLALTAMPYGYYVFMRWVVCAACVYGAVAAHHDGNATWTWVLGAAAFLFNPIVPIQMHRAQWVPFDLAGAALLIVAAVMLRPRSGTSEVH